MPNRQVQPRDSWPVRLPMLIKTGPKPIVIDLVVTCTYEGTRTRQGNPEALVSFKGQVNGRDELKDKTDGQVAGKFTFDSKRGFISSVKMAITSEATAPGSELSLVFALNVDLQRSDGNPDKIKLPNRTPPVVKKDDPKSGNPDFKPTVFTRPAASKMPTSYMKIESSPGDCIGQGKSYEHRGDELKAKGAARFVQI